MVEITIPNKPQTEFVVEEGKFKGMTKQQYKHRLKIENLIKRTTSARSFKGYLTGTIKVAKTDGNQEVQTLLEDLMKKYLEYTALNSDMPITIEIENWKGKDNIEIFNGFTDDFIIVSHRKEKLTGEVITLSHTVPHENVNRILFFIKKWQVGEKHKCYDFAEVLGFKDWKSLWKERKIYFETYYHPIKVLEKIGVIEYNGRGDVKRIK